MNQTSLAAFETLDPEVLASAVRQDQRSFNFQIDHWSVHSLNNQGIINPFGLILFEGLGHDEHGERPWSVVLKALKRPEEEASPSDLNYWKREILFAQAVQGIENGRASLIWPCPPEGNPLPLRHPRFYGMVDSPEGAWLWMEHVQGRYGVGWSVEDFSRAAEALGRWNGQFVTSCPLPDLSWLAINPARQWVGDDDPTLLWQDPLLQKFASNRREERHRRLWAERERLFTAQTRLPQIFSHFDFQPRNLFLAPSGPEESQVVAIDWALCGIGPLGGDLSALILNSLVFFEGTVAELDELEATVFQSYLQGLRQAGWQGSEQLPRLGYLSYSALWFCLIFPFPLSFWAAEANRERAEMQLGKSGEEVLHAYEPVIDALLDRGEEALRLYDALFGE